ncbi:enoyl-CoA delta isomerase 2-like isoform X2 [Vespa mandarinia]|uniref:enoyl-CoA delta isomerase 2-like isoform X2 n=1 Tax=Vespa mandarinia TaxID=7446 RepID=UPI0016159E2D|nr:enoyl-CoA delta isomerase 2-like isoform X2 [Vespa mandarinia]
MEGHILKVNLENGIQKIILNRPKKKNALSIKMYQEIENILNDSSKNDSIHMVVLTGAGDFFTSGNDINVLYSIENFIHFKNFIDALITFPKLLVAIVNGPAIGIGTTMLGLFDIVYASEKAGDMLYLGYKMNAKEAKEYHLVGTIYKDVEEIWIYLRKLNQLSIKSIMAIKYLVQKWNKQTLLEVNKTEVEELKKICESKEVTNKLLNFISNKNKL